MEERRIKLRRHIQAARAWLLQADKSLEHENDVQGDLKLMLAKAELAQARGSHRSWIKKIFPPLTAIMIAGFVMLSNQSVVTDEAPPVSTVEPESEITLLEQTPTLQPDAPVELAAIAAEEPAIEPVIEPTYEPAFEEYETEEPIFIEEAPLEYSTAEYAAEEPVVEDYAEYYEPAIERVPEEPTYISEPMSVPTEDMQRLMLDAGQILRAK